MATNISDEDQDSPSITFPRKKSLSSSRGSSFVKHSWIERHIKRVVCVKFVPRYDQPDKCGCGESLQQHENPESSLQGLGPGAGSAASTSDRLLSSNEGFTRWNPVEHTLELPTDAFGTLEFQAGPHPSKARYARLSSNTAAAHILHLLFHEWKLRVPNLVISVMGGYEDFSMQPKLKQVFQTGLIKAATTTGAWLVTNGLDKGVTKHVGEAIRDYTNHYGNQVIALGIAPWGMVHHREYLKGKNKVCAYHCVSSRLKQDSILCKGHTHFLLADNGSIEKFGAELHLRRNLEQFLAKQYIDMRKHGGTKSQVPIIAVLVEGGSQSFSSVRQLLTNPIPIPVVICDGSGRAADILAFAYKFSNDDGHLPAELREQLTSLILKTFHVKRVVADSLYFEMEHCMRHKALIHVYRMLSGVDIDVTILTALLNVSSEKLSPAGQLSLTMAWNRPDLARSKVFKFGRIWKRDILENAMLDALVNNRLEFVKLLLENGVSMTKFLTTQRLELLYSMSEVEENKTFLRHMREVLGSKEMKHFSLRLVGRYIEELMGDGYHHAYCHKELSSHVYSPQDGEVHLDPQGALHVNNALVTFRYPYTELMQWCVLTHRFEMASYMILSGEEAIAKALLATRLCKCVRKSIVKEAAFDRYTKMKQWQKDFERHAVELQEFCFKLNPTETQRLMMYELQQFSKHTCISLAYLCKSKAFLALAGTQTILSDLWYGGLQQCHLIDFKIMFALVSVLSVVLWPVLGLLLWKYPLFLQFKTKKQLSDQPQTLDEHLSDISDSSSDSSSDTTTTGRRSSSTSRRSSRVDIPAVVFVNSSPHVSRQMSVKKREKTVTKDDFEKNLAHLATRISHQDEQIPLDEMANQEGPRLVENSGPSTSIEIFPRRHSCPNMNWPLFNHRGEELSSVVGLTEEDEEDMDAQNEDPEMLDTTPSSPHSISNNATLSTPTQRNRSYSSTNPTRPRTWRRLPFAEPWRTRRTQGNVDHSPVEAIGSSSTQLAPMKATKSSKNKFPASKPPKGRRISLQPQSQVQDPKKVSFGQRMKGTKMDRITLDYTTDEEFGSGKPVKDRYYFHTSASVPLFNTIASSDVSLPGAPTSTIGGAGAYAGNKKTASFHVENHHQTGTLRDQLGVRTKVYEFFNAPITRYYIHLISFIVFLGLFIHISSVKYPPFPLWPQEVIVHAYVYIYFLDKFREILAGSGSNLRDKVKKHFKNFWNVFDHVACVSTLFAMVFRYVSLVHPDVYYSSTRAWSSVCCGIWAIRFVELMKIWHFMGPTVYVSGEMLKEMIPLLILLFLAIFSFGTMRHGMMTSYNTTQFTMVTVRDILMEPYCMLYGVIFPETIDPGEWFKEKGSPSTPLNWIVPVVMVIYMLIICFLDVSVLLARFNDVYSSVQRESEVVFRFVRHAFIIEYQAIPLLPPPFTIFSWAYSMVRFVLRWIKRRNTTRNRGIQNGGLKLFLSREEIEKLHDFEEDCVERYTRNARLKQIQAQDESLVAMSSNLCDMSYYVEKIIMRQYSNRASVLGRLIQFDTDWNNRYEQLVRNLNPYPKVTSASTPATTPGVNLINPPWDNRTKKKK